jgi:single-strand DNA-binding protein
MATYNKVTLVGNLTRDPELRFLANEQAVAKFGLAVNRRFKGRDGQQQEEVTFVDIETWGRTAELAGQYLAKGRSCLIEGRLKQENWEDKATGQKRSKLLVIAENIQFMDSKRDEQAAERSGPARRAPSHGDDGGPGGSACDEEPPF